MYKFYSICNCRNGFFKSRPDALLSWAWHVSESLPPRTGSLIQHGLVFHVHLGWHTWKETQDSWSRFASNHTWWGKTSISYQSLIDVDEEQIIPLRGLVWKNQASHLQQLNIKMLQNQSLQSRYSCLELKARCQFTGNQHSHFG